jgi:pimeloyl-ACP methyl ester carboxylesterase
MQLHCIDARPGLRVAGPFGPGGVLMPAQTQYAHNQAVTVAYESFGDLATGEPLLLISGLDFQMVWWPDAFTTLDMLDDAIAVMDAVGWKSAHVMGVSMGAALAQALVLYHPDRVRTLTSAMGVPADVSGLGAMRYIKFGVFLKLRKIKQATTREGQIDNLVEMIRTFGSPGYPFPGDWARSVATVSHDRSPRDPKSTQRQLAAGRAQKIPPISGIHVPALVFCGRQDPIIKPKASQDLAARIPGAKLVIYPGMGHSLPAELWPDMVGRITALAGLS